MCSTRIIRFLTVLGLYIVAVMPASFILSGCSGNKMSGNAAGGSSLGEGDGRAPSVSTDAPFDIPVTIAKSEIGIDRRSLELEVITNGGLIPLKVAGDLAPCISETFNQIDFVGLSDPERDPEGFAARLYYNNECHFEVPLTLNQVGTTLALMGVFRESNESIGTQPVFFQVNSLNNGEKYSLDLILTNTTGIQLVRPTPTEGGVFLSMISKEGTPYIARYTDKDGVTPFVTLTSRALEIQVGGSTLYSLDATGQLTAIDHDTHALSFVMGDVATFAVSPDGHTIAYTTRGHPSTILLFDARGSQDMGEVGLSVDPLPDSLPSYTFQDNGRLLVSQASIEGDFTLETYEVSQNFSALVLGGAQEKALIMDSWCHEPACYEGDGGGCYLQCDLSGGPQLYHVVKDEITGPWTPAGRLLDSYDASPMGHVVYTSGGVLYYLDSHSRDHTLTNKRGSLPAWRGDGCVVYFGQSTGPSSLYLDCSFTPGTMSGGGQSGGGIEPNTSTPPQEPTYLTLENLSQPVAHACTSLKVRTVDENGNCATMPGNKTVTLDGDVSFSVDPSCRDLDEGSIDVTMDRGECDLQLYYQSPQATEVILTATAEGLETETYTFMVLPTPAKSLGLSGDAKLSVNLCSTYTVSALDSGGHETTIDKDLHISMAQVGGSVDFFMAPDCKEKSNSVVMKGGTGSVRISLKATKSHSFTLVANDNYAALKAATMEVFMEK